MAVGHGLAIPMRLAHPSGSARVRQEQRQQTLIHRLELQPVRYMGHRLLQGVRLPNPVSTAATQTR